MSSPADDKRECLRESITSSFDDQLHSFVRVERCPLCLRTARNFYCRMCVQSGEFGHTRGEAAGPQFASGKLQLFRLHHELITYIIAVEDGTEKQRRAAGLQQRLTDARKRCRIAASAVSSARQRVKTAADRLTAVRRRCQLLRQRQPCLRTRLIELAGRQEATIPTRQRVTRRLSILRRLSDSATRTAFHQLTTFIFPVQEVRNEKPKPLSPTERALADAQSLSHVHGRWVQLERCDQRRYRIVAPTLPASGDYSAYGVWLAACAGSAAPVSGVIDNPAHNMTAALTYIAQLLNIVSFYTSIRLPNPLCYSRFCSAPPALSERRFRHLTAVLNANLLHMCFRLNVNVHRLVVTRTGVNLMLLLDAPSLATGGEVVTSDAGVMRSLIDAMEESLRSDLDNGADEANDGAEELTDVTTPGSGDDDGGQWEQVSLEVPTVPDPSTAANSASVATALVSTAAASVASFFRGFNR